jgi:hypothetical protein
MMPYTFAELQTIVGIRTGGRYALTKWSPGDGVTRYRIVLVDVDDDYADYFGSSPVMTALGRKEATLMVWSFIAGLDARS